MLLSAACLLGLLALLHHPVHGDSQASIGGAILPLNPLVHASMLAVVLLMVACLAQYTAVRGWHRLLPRTGFLLFAVGGLAGCFAGLINGFIAPDVMQYAPTSAGEDAGFGAVRVALWAGNQRLVALAGSCFAAAVACWSLDLLRSPGRRGLAGSSLFLAVAEVAWQWNIDSRFDVGAMQVFWLWLCLACIPWGWVLFAGGAEPATPPSP